MNQPLRDRIARRLESLPDERLYQVLDYVEFLESKYAQRQAPQNLFTRFQEGLEDTLRAGKVSTSAISETMGFMSKAMGVLSGVAAAGRSVATDIVGAATPRAPGEQGGATGGSGVVAPGTGGATDTAGAGNRSSSPTAGVPPRTTTDPTGGSTP